MSRETKHYVTKHLTHALPTSTPIRALPLLGAQVMGGAGSGGGEGGRREGEEGSPKHVNGAEQRANKAWL